MYRTNSAISISGVSVDCGEDEAGAGRDSRCGSPFEVVAHGMHAISVRPFSDGDAAVTARIYFDAVRIGAKSHYDESQRRAWAPEVPPTLQWLDRLKSQPTFVAELEERVVGFMTIDDTGYIDLAFVAPDMTGKGVAGCLYEVVEAQAARSSIPVLHAHASHMARPFFERRGWSVVAEQSVSRGGVVLTNFRMEKHLEAGEPG